MWSGHLHDTDFVEKVLGHLEVNTDKYGTATRMKGMLTVAKEVRVSFRLTSSVSESLPKELQTPFYFTPSKIASFFHCMTPPLEDIA